MTFIWLAVIGALVVVELVTYGLYFAALAIAAVVPLVISLIAKLQGTSPEKMTNSAALIGKSAEVVEEVTELAGYVKVQGETWTARTSSGVRAVGSKVVIEQIDGATLIAHCC